MLLTERPCLRLVDQDIYLFLQEYQLLLHLFDQSHHILLSWRWMQKSIMLRPFAHSLPFLSPENVFAGYTNLILRIPKTPTHQGMCLDTVFLL